MEHNMGLDGWVNIDTLFFNEASLNPRSDAHHEKTPDSTCAQRKGRTR